MVGEGTGGPVRRKMFLDAAMADATPYATPRLVGDSAVVNASPLGVHATRRVLASRTRLQIKGITRLVF